MLNGCFLFDTSVARVLKESGKLQNATSFLKHVLIFVQCITATKGDHVVALQSLVDNTWKIRWDNKLCDWFHNQSEFHTNLTPNELKLIPPHFGDKAIKFKFHSQSNSKL